MCGLCDGQEVTLSIAHCDDTESLRWQRLISWKISPTECVFFFFQAEDGIRDVAVTGVQTCALPISLAPPNAPVKLRRACAAATLPPTSRAPSDSAGC